MSANSVPKYSVCHWGDFQISFSNQRKCQINDFPKRGIFAFYLPWWCSSSSILSPSVEHGRRTVTDEMRWDEMRHTLVLSLHHIRRFIGTRLEITGDSPNYLWIMNCELWKNCHVAHQINYGLWNMKYERTVWWHT